MFPYDSRAYARKGRQWEAGLGQADRRISYPDAQLQKRLRANDGCSAIPVGRGKSVAAEAVRR